MNSLVAIIIAFLLDLIIGDPYHWPHPIKIIGNFIYYFLKVSQSWKVNKYIVGLLLWLSTVILSVGLSWFILHGALYMHESLYWILWIYLAYTTLATRSLAFEAKKVYHTLMSGTIEDARYQVSMIVGRETKELTREEISKATIETVAENTSDGVIGPLLCLFIGGPVLAMGYKAINTLDSMVGYKTEKYKQIGFISAKVDDLVNLIPARVTFLVLLLTTQVMQYPIKETFKIAWRDRYQHASPNSAFTEAVVAGALGIQLGGTHVYHGELIHKPTIGNKTREVVADDIMKTVMMLYLSVALTLIIGLAIMLSLKNFN